MARFRLFWVVPALAALVMLAYANSLHRPFVLDDEAAIPGNPTLASWRTMWFPPPNGAATVSGRPLLNVSFALNHHFGGTAVMGYHVGNALIHFCAGLLLFGILRRSVKPSLDIVAVAVTAWWLVHPLQTESVTYIVQRAESLAALWMLLSLYAFVRWTERERVGKVALEAQDGTKTTWQVISIAAAWAGVLSKETAAALPLLVFAYDAAFVSGGVRAALSARWRYYLALGGAWIVLAVLVGGRGGTVGFGLGVGLAEHISTQLRAIAHYLSLAVWPRPLVFFYGKHWPGSVLELVLATGIVAALVALFWALTVRRPRLAFLVLAFFCLLAPSSVLPVASEIVAEHRMYLALALPLIAVALALRVLLSRRFWVGALAVALVLMTLTVRRNQDYRSAVALWRDTVTKLPGNPYAHGNLGLALLAEGNTLAARESFAMAVSIEPNYAEAHSNLGNLALNAWQLSEALTEFETALRLRPDFAEVHANYASLLLRLRRNEEAITHLQEAVRLKPELPGVADFLVQQLSAAGRLEEAVAVMTAVVQREPVNEDARRKLEWLSERSSHDKAVGGRF